MIISPQRKIVDENGDMNNRMRAWTELVTELQMFVGAGSPEGVVEADQTRLYMDTAGIAGAILYIKRDTDIAGDKSQGWILV